jgi:hypothetical protein
VDICNRRKPAPGGHHDAGIPIGSSYFLLARIDGSVYALSGPVPPNHGIETPPPRIGKYLQDVGKLMQAISMHSIRTYTTKLKDDSVMVEL